MRGRDHQIVGLLIAETALAGIGDEGQEEPRFALGAGVGAGQDRQVEHRLAPDLDHRLVEHQGLAPFVFHHPLGPDRPGRRPRRAARLADRAGRVDHVGQDRDVVVGVGRSRGRDLDMLLQARGETHREARVHVLVERELVGELGRAVVGDDLDVSGGDDLALVGVVVDAIGSEDAALVARLDVAGGLDVVLILLADDLVRLEVEAAAAQAVRFRWRRRGLGGRALGQGLVAQQVVVGAVGVGGLGARGAGDQGRAQESGVHKTGREPEMTARGRRGPGPQPRLFARHAAPCRVRRRTSTIFGITKQGDTAEQRQQRRRPGRQTRGDFAVGAQGAAELVEEKHARSRGPMPRRPPRMPRSPMRMSRREKAGGEDGHAGDQQRRGQ